MRRLAYLTLYMTDAEIAAELGIETESWKSTAAVLEKDGLPKFDPLFGRRRYWPAVRAYLDRRNGLGNSSSIGTIDGEENWNGRYGNDRRARARA
jgi:hypothetical protein